MQNHLVTSRVGLAVAALAVATSCGARDTTGPTGHAGATGLADPGGAPRAAAAPVPPADFAVVDGAWRRDPVGGRIASIDGLVGDGDTVWTVVSDGQNGGASLLHRAVAGGAWSTDALADPSLGIAGAAVALVGGQPEVAVAVMDPATLDVAYRVLSPGGAHEVLAEACSPRPVRLLDDPAGTVVVYTCAGRVHVARRAVGGAWQEHATVEQMPLVAAIDGAGDVHLLGGTIAGGPTHRIVHDGAVEAAPLPAEVYAVEDAVACGGVVHATFEVRTGDAADARAVALGRLIDGAWQLDPVESEWAGGAVLGFDEACHPFVAIGDQVWARGRDGWVDTRIGFDSESVRALLGRGGTLFAAYTVLKDSQRAGIATATLRLE